MKALSLPRDAWFFRNLVMSTPQVSTSFTRSPVKNPSDANSYAQLSFNNGQNMSFASQNSQSHHSQQNPLLGHGHSSQHGAMQQSPYRSFNEPSQASLSRQIYEKPQIYTVWCSRSMLMQVLTHIRLYTLESPCTKWKSTVSLACADDRMAG